MEKSTSLRIFILALTSWKIKGRFKNVQLFLEKIKNSRKYCPASTGTTFSTKFIPNAQV